ncbi:MAG: hypothetical protein HKN76_20130, partial [Saprospiraceae bacterium]|nr:hypothetical protein [Saprospiraceae bacterium]
HWDLTVARLIALRYADNDLLDLLQKVPFALAANISGYIHQHQPDEVERLCEQIREIARPFIGIIASPDLALDPKLSVGTKVSLRKFCPEPGIWLDYFLEDYEPAVSQMEKDKVSKELLPVFNSFSTSETSPDLIKSCIQRYFNKQRNSSDPLKSMKEYLFKVVEI